MENVWQSSFFLGCQRNTLRSSQTEQLWQVAKQRHLHQLQTVARHEGTRPPGQYTQSGNQDKFTHYMYKIWCDRENFNIFRIIEELVVWDISDFMDSAPCKVRAIMKFLLLCPYNILVFDANLHNTYMQAGLI